MATFGGTPRFKVAQLSNRDAKRSMVMDLYPKDSATGEFPNTGVLRPPTHILSPCSFSLQRRRMGCGAFRSVFKTLLTVLYNCDFILFYFICNPIITCEELIYVTRFVG